GVVLALRRTVEAGLELVRAGPPVLVVGQVATNGPQRRRRQRLRPAGTAGAISLEIAALNESTVADDSRAAGPLRCMDDRVRPAAVVVGERAGIGAALVVVGN